MKNTINTIFALFFVMVGATQIYGMELVTTEQPTHSVYSVKSASILGNNKTTIISDLNTLKNKVGEEGLSLIYNELMQQYTKSQSEDAFEDFKENSFPIVFNEFNRQTKKQELYTLIFERKSILSSKSQPSTLEKLQYCLHKDASINKHVSSNNTTNKKYFIAAGISVSILLLLFVAHKLKLLPTELPTPFKNILSKISENVTLPSNIKA